MACQMRGYAISCFRCIFVKSLYFLSPNNEHIVTSASVLPMRLDTLLVLVYILSNRLYNTDPFTYSGV